MTITEITPDSVTVTDPTGFITAGSGGSGTANGLTFEVLSIRNGTAVLRFTGEPWSPG